MYLPFLRPHSSHHNTTLHAAPTFHPSAQIWYSEKNIFALPASGTCQNMNHFSLPVKRAMRTVHSAVTSRHTAVRHIANHGRRTQRQAEKRAYRLSGVIHRLMILSVNPNEVPFELLTHGVQDIPTFCFASSRHGLPANRPITSFTGSTRKATMLPNTFELHSV